MAPSTTINILRAIFSAIDGAVYKMIATLYEIFFYVSTSTIISGEIVSDFFQRIQLIIGIFMIFKLAISLLNLIVNPELAKDRNAGTGQIVMRVVVCLLLLTLVVPLHIQNTQPGTYNGFINDNGILFGTLYAAQDAILRENVLAKLILGIETKDTSQPGQIANVNALNSGQAAGQILSTSVLRGFVLVNVKDETADTVEKDNIYCPAEIEKSGYTDSNASIDTILSATDRKCNTDQGSRYAFDYITVIPTVVGVIIGIILLGFTIDVAIRALKLAVLRIIAPIPIISYVDPKASKDGAFASWVKTLTSTYLDLFIRLAIIYFVIFIVQSIAKDGTYIAIPSGASGLVRAFTYVFIVLGLLFFAKQAPNFIKAMLGSKGVGFGPGVSGALGFMGGFLGGGGLAGAAAAGVAAANTTNEAQAQGKQAPGGWSTGRDLVAKMKTGDDKATGGFLSNAQRSLINRGKRVVGGKVLQRKFGITADEADKAKAEMFQASDFASDMANMRGNFNMRLGGSFKSLKKEDGSINTTTREGQLLNEFVSTHSGDANVKNWLEGHMSDDAFMDYMVNTTQSEFQRQKKNYEDADALIKQFGNGVSLEDKYATGASRYYARARNKASEVASNIPGVRNIGRRTHNSGYGKGGWERTYVDQGVSKSDQVTPKYSDAKDWKEISKKK